MIRSIVTAPLVWMFTFKLPKQYVGSVTQKIQNPLVLWQNR